MRKLTKGELAALVRRFKAVGRHGIENTPPDFLELLNQEVRLDLPVGELVNPAIKGLVLAWKFQALPIVEGRITDQHQFNAQGMEGLVSISMRLAMALLTATMVDQYRMDVFVPPGWKGRQFCEASALAEEEDEGIEE